jgi:anti-anti-sigma factor
MAPDCLARTRQGDRIGVGGSVYEVMVGEGDRRQGGGTAAAAAERLLQQRLGPRRPLSEWERGLLCTKDLAGIPVHAVGLRRVTDPSETRSWRGILRELANRPCAGRLVLDLRAVHALSVEAVDVLLAFRRRLEAVGSAVKVCDVRPPVLRVLQEAGADRVIPVVPDATEAVWSWW